MQQKLKLNPNYSPRDDPHKTFKSMESNKNYFGIYNSWDRYDEDLQNETREMLAECNDIPVEEVSDEWVMESIEGNLDDEKSNLDISTGGYIIAFADLGFWNGRTTGYKMIGANVNNIFDSFLGGDECEWYADRYNVRARASHHDGSHYICFRYVDSYEQAEKVGKKIRSGAIKSEADFFRYTKSIRPFVAHTYGWQEFGHQLRAAA